jgi:hypothetical protein
MRFAPRWWCAYITEPFQQDQLWRYAADFKTNTGKQLGVKWAIARWP